MTAPSRVAAAHAADDADRARWGLSPFNLSVASAMRMAEHYDLEAMRAEAVSTVAHLGAAKAAEIASDHREQAAYYRAMAGEAA